MNSITGVTLNITYPNATTEARQMPVGTWTIGRETGDVVLGDTAVSSRHAQLELTAHGLTFTDLGSTNGSYLASGDRVTASVPLQEGSQLRLGGCTLSVGAFARMAPAGTQIMEAQAAAGPPAAPAPIGGAEVVAPGVPAPAPAVPAGSPVAHSGHSHPDHPLRHSYPLHITDAGFSTAVGLLLKTLPYALVRFAILVGMSLVSIVWFAATLGGIGWLMPRSSMLAGVWGAVGFGAFGALWRFIVRYFLYLLKCGHIAVLTELITKGAIGNGQTGMFSYGKNVVQERFGQVNVLFGLDLLVHGIVRAFNRTLSWVASLLPIPGLQSAVGIVNKIVYAATTYIDETIFSYNLARGDDNVWRSSQDGLVYYAQNSQGILKTGVWIVVLDYVLTALVWIVMLAPAFAISYVLPAAVVEMGTLFVFFIAILFAGNVRSAFLKPLFLSMVMVKFHVSVKNQPINLEWDQKLTSASNKFRELKDRARDFGAEPAPAARPAVQPAQ